MGIYIQWDIKRQRVNQIKLDEQEQQPIIQCSRDKRIRAVDQITGQKGTINRHARRQARDALLGYPCV